MHHTKGKGACVPQGGATTTANVVAKKLHVATAFFRKPSTERKKNRTSMHDVFWEWLDVEDAAEQLLIPFGFPALDGFNGQDNGDTGWPLSVCKTVQRALNNLK